MSIKKAIERICLKMNDEDKEILNNFVNKKKQVLEFKEIQSIVRLLIDINNKISPVVIKQE
ncbi:MAG: hypothetical protein HFJ51_00050 [Clostridia bacterium]|nr:hypothetical protein [Clostridia bacterium]